MALYQCECGNLKEMYFYEVKIGRFQSCGCIRNRKSAERARLGNCKKPLGVASFNSIYDRYRRQAIAAAREWQLTKDEFKKITSSDCHYCGSPPSQISNSKRSHGAYKYNGIDRKDNSLGYSTVNALPCCGICNSMKSNRSYDIFLAHVNQITQFTHHNLLRESLNDSVVNCRSQ